jgi:hypothetical protein
MRPYLFALPLKRNVGSDGLFCAAHRSELKQLGAMHIATCAEGKCLPIWKREADRSFLLETLLFVSFTRRRA